MKTYIKFISSGLSKEEHIELENRIEAATYFDQFEIPEEIDDSLDQYLIECIETPKLYMNRQVRLSRYEQIR